MTPQRRHRLFLPRSLTPVAEREAARRFDLRRSERTLEVAEALDSLHQHRAEAMIIGSNLRLDARFFNEVPDDLRAVATTGVGTDHIDLAAARCRGIAIRNVPATGAEDTADLTMMHILMACRRAPAHEATMRAGWGRRAGFGEGLGRRVTGRRLGIVGMGRVGCLVADRARGFGMTVSYHHRRSLPERPERFCADLDDMLEEIDVLTLHLPLTPETVNLISADRLARMPCGAVLINCARGGLVDEGALIDALNTGHLFAAGLDVFQGEPSPDPRLLARPEVSLTPHVGSATQEARDEIGLRCLKMVAEELSRAAV